MRFVYHYIILCLVPLLAGCSGCGRSKKTDWTLDFAVPGKKPYSVYLIQESLPLLFPTAKTEKLRKDYRITNLGYKLRANKGKSMLVMIGLRTRFAEGEIDSLFAYVKEGHQVLLSANWFDKELMDRLQLSQSPQSVGGNDMMQQIFLRDKNDSLLPYSYRYKDYSVHGHFNSKDTANYPFYTLGTDEDKRPDCIVFSIGSGRLLLHAAPLAFSNYFLLQQDNRTYLNALFRYIPEELSNVYLCTFNYREIASSDWSVIWGNVATRTALLLSLFSLLIFVVFEMKRRQKVIPIIAPLENTSVAFTETIGRLYYNKRDHTNLSEKMVQHFLDFVRNSYYLGTNQLDSEFVRHLAAKSGKSIAETDTLVQTIKEVQSGVKADEAFLYSLYNQIQQFYHGK